MRDDESAVSGRDNESKFQSSKRISFSLTVDDVRATVPANGPIHESPEGSGAGGRRKAGPGETEQAQSILMGGLPGRIDDVMPRRLA
ncbi:hypothetical protein EMIT0158MI4_270021 [Burkholderia ambifaria]